MKRSEFIKGCGLSVCVGGGLISLLSSCATLPIVKTEANTDKVIEVDATLFKDGKQLLVRTQKLDQDILLIKKSDTDYTALYMECTHYPNNLNYNATSIYCNSHGSQFDLEGKVTQGPASKNLVKYTTSISNNIIKIQL